MSKADRKRMIRKDTKTPLFPALAEGLEASRMEVMKYWDKVRGSGIDPVMEHVQAILNKRQMAGWLEAVRVNRLHNS